MTCPRLPRTPDGSGAPLDGHEEGGCSRWWDLPGQWNPAQRTTSSGWIGHTLEGDETPGGFKRGGKKAGRQLLGGSEISRAEAAVPRPVNNVILVDVLRYLVKVGVKLLSFLQVTVSVEFVTATMRDEKGAEGSWEGGETPPSQTQPQWV